MKRKIKLQYLMLTLLSFLMLGLFITPAWSAEQPDNRSKAKLSIIVGPNGFTTVYLSLDFIPDDSSEISPAITALLGCQPENINMGKEEYETDEDDLPTEEEAKDPEWQPQPPGWYFNAVSSCAFKQAGLITRGALNFAPLVEALRKLKITTLHLDLSHPQKIYAQYSQPLNVTSSYGSSRISYSINVNDAPPPVLRLEYGYRTSEFLKLYGRYFAVLLLPIILLLLARSYALKVAEKDRARAWFSYWQVQRFMLTASWFGWFLVIYPIKLDRDDLIVLMTSNVLRIPYLILVLLRYFPMIGTVVSMVCYYLPPVIVAIICMVISYPVYTRVRGLSWTRQEILWQAILSQLSGTMPYLCYLIAFSSFIQGETTFGLALAGIGFLLRQLFLAILQKAQGVEVKRLISGLLYHRIMELAHQTGVKIKAILLLLSDREQQVNAFAARGNKVILTEFLLPQLNRREVDAVMAHELSHIKLNHPAIILLCTLSALALPAVLSVSIWPSHWQYIWPVLLGIGMLVNLQIKRRLEYVADREAVALTGDAGALISALSKISRISFTPMQWGRLEEFFLSHPSTQRRIEAIAVRNNIFAEQLMALTSQSRDFYSANADEHYDLRATPMLDARPNAGFAAEQKEPIYKNALVRIALRGGIVFLGVGLLVIIDSPVRGLLAQAQLPALILPFIVFAVSVHLSANNLKQKILAVTPRSIKLGPADAAGYSQLDQTLLAQKSAELQSLGFRIATDFTAEFNPRSSITVFSRLFINQEDHCLAEVGQVFLSNGMALPMVSIISSQLEDNWNFSITTSEPDASAYINMLPKSLVISMPQASLTEMLAEHLERRKKISKELGCQVLPADVNQYFYRQHQATALRRRQQEEESMLSKMIKGARFEQQPRFEMLDDYQEFIRRRGKRS